MYYIRQRKSVILSKLFRSNIKKCWTWRQKITVWDHNRDLLSQRASTILDDPQASKYVWELVSIGMKAGGDPCLIMLVKFTKCIHKNFFTEGCVEKFDY
jgi:glucosylceramidase